MFSIIIVTFNNIRYLQLCIDSINKNSHFENQIFVHVNGGNDGTTEWLEEQGIPFTHTAENIGLTAAANRVAIKAFNRYVCLIDDDMYVLPNWDKELINFKNENNLSNEDWLCCTAIERNAGCSGSLNGDYGDIDTFHEDELLADYRHIKAVPMVCTQLTPLLIDLVTWKKIGGYDEDFWVIGAEEGLAMRMHNNGCQHFVSVPKSLVYHFQCITSDKMPNRQFHSIRREQVFSDKYGMTTKDFNAIIGRGNKW